jgi:DNA mismatch repair protein MutL
MTDQITDAAHTPASTPAIKLLPEQLINKIAAGEVVERPASVIKELVENAIDAHATRIDIHIRNAGKSQILIDDNGHGMDKGDALTALERHATSKIANIDDLDNIQTLGFRGEALSSIAAVSQFELKTRTAASETGTRIKVQGGQLAVAEACAMNNGTQITVANLFFNTPARRAFLKSNATEKNHIIRTIRRLALSQPQIQFRFYNEERLDLQYLPESIEDRVFAVLNSKTEAQMMSIEGQLDTLKILGWITLPDYFHTDRFQQYMFINGRFIVNRTLSYAIYNTFESIVGAAHHPAYVLYLSMDPALFDINVHPTKTEVRFANEKVVVQFVRKALVKALEDGSIMPQMLASDSRGNRNSSFASFSPTRDDKPLSSPIVTPVEPENSRQMTLHYFDPKTARVDIPATTQPVKPGSTFAADIWQFQQRYIFSHLQSGLLIIDQNRAHQRVLYEQILNSAEQKRHRNSQRLLFPQLIELTLEQFNLYLELQPFFSLSGFDIETYSGTSINVMAIPADIANGRESSIVQEIIDTIEDEEKSAVFDAFARSYAKNNALRKGEKLSLEACHALMDQLFACEQPYYSPYGKPIIVNMTNADIDKKFK